MPFFDFFEAKVEVWGSAVPEGELDVYDWVFGWDAAAGGGLA